MGFDNPPWIMDATTVDGEVIRRAIGSLINSAGGIVTPGDLTVTQNGTPNMTVNIGLGQIWVPGSSTATQGPYYSRNGGSISQAINSSDPTNPRIDTVGVQVQDAAYAGALKQINPLYVAGTATAGANLTNLTGKGAVPASSYVLAYVLVPATATSIVTADILNVAALISRAGAWVPLSLGTGFAVASGYDTPSVRQEGDTVRFKGAIENTSGVQPGVNATIATIPSSGLHPPFTRGVGGTLFGGFLGQPMFTVTTAGVLTNPGLNISSSSAAVLSLDGATFSLT